MKPMVRPNFNFFVTKRSSVFAMEAIPAALRVADRWMLSPGLDNESHAHAPEYVEISSNRAIRAPVVILPSASQHQAGP